MLFRSQSTRTRDESETLALYPDRLESLLSILKLPLGDMGVRKEILARLQQIISADHKISPAVLAKVSVELGDLPRAADAYLLAIRESPFDVGLRMEASLVLERAGRLEAARDVVGLALALAPQRADIKKRFQDLISRENTAVENTQDRKNSRTDPENR